MKLIKCVNKCSKCPPPTRSRELVICQDTQKYMKKREFSSVLGPQVQNLTVVYEDFIAMFKYIEKSPM